MREVSIRYTKQFVVRDPGPLPRWFTNPRTREEWRRGQVIRKRLSQRADEYFWRLMSR